MVDLLRRVLDGFDQALRHIGVLLLATVVVVALLQVVIRYISGIPMVWTEELARNLLVWMTFLLMGPAFKAGLHYSVDYVITSLPLLGRVWLHRVGDLFTLAFGIFMFWIGISYTLMTGGARTPALEISAGWISSSLPVGAAILCIYAVCRLVISFFEPESVDELRREETQL